MNFSHDQAFKNLFIDFTDKVVEFAAHEEWARMPPGMKFESLREETSTEELGKLFRELDFPLEARFPDGHTEALVFVIENESTNRAEFLHYLAIVCLHMSMMKKTRRVVPVAVHPFRKTPLNNALKLGSDAQTYLDFSCISCVLHTMNALDYVDSRNIITRLCLPLMKHDPKDQMFVAIRAAEGLVELEPRQEVRKKYSKFITHYAKIEEENKDEFYRKYVYVSPFKEEIMTLYDVLHEEGKAEGKVENVVDLFEAGEIDADQARAWLDRLTKTTNLPRNVIDDALAKVDAVKRPAKRRKKS